ncbi:MAG: TRAP transporter small permease [Clostridiales bacterium]|nr:TRAP transporter small permease [Clostridiales bacterium]
MNSPKSKLEKVDAVITNCIKYVSYVSGACLIGIMLVAFFNVIGEKLRAAGLPITGIPASTEIVSYLHIPVVFLAAAYVQLDRGHTRIDMLSSKFPKAVEKFFITVGYFFGIIICSVVAWRAIILMGKFIKTHRMSSVTGVGFPLWPFALMTVVGFLMLALSFLWSIIKQYAMKDQKIAETTGLKGGAI